MNERAQTTAATAERLATPEPQHATPAPRHATPEPRHAGAGDARLDIASGLLQLSGLVHGIYSRVSERHDLTPVQAKLLCVLLDGPRGMAELASCFGVEKAALTGLMDRAERRGLAQRSSVPGDRRALRVTLTDAGRRAATAFHAEVSAEIGRLIAPLDPGDRERFRGALAEIIASCRASQGPEHR